MRPQVFRDSSPDPCAILGLTFACALDVRGPVPLVVRSPVRAHAPSAPARTEAGLLVLDGELSHRLRLAAARAPLRFAGSSHDSLVAALSGRGPAQPALEQTFYRFIARLATDFAKEFHGSAVSERPCPVAETPAVRHARRSVRAARARDRGSSSATAAGDGHATRCPAGADRKSVV